MSASAISLRAPIIVMVLAATAIPVELRPDGRGAMDFGIQASDVVANVAGYIPLGMVLSGLGPLRAVMIAAVLSGFAETSQLFMMHRDASGIDIAANVIGAALGVAASALGKLSPPALKITRWTTFTAATLVLGLIVGVWSTSADALNDRGATSPGRLEAQWKPDEDRQTADAIRLGPSRGLRLTGSMTVSAWIKSSSYPADDAAIVSSLSPFPGPPSTGFQLDTTVDRGPRTVGFKLNDACGRGMARYGRTPLLVNTSYHVAGVYDAEARTLDVFVNGELDNGVLSGSISGAQRSSRNAVYIGRRRDLNGFEFSGSIDDVRIYSMALTKPEVQGVMHGERVDGPPADRLAGAAIDRSRGTTRTTDHYAPCGWSSEREDARLPGAVAALGVLVALVGVGLWSSARPILCVILSAFAGLLLLQVASPTLPAVNLWLFPLTSLAGGVSVMASVQRAVNSPAGAATATIDGCRPEVSSAGVGPSLRRDVP